MIPIMPTAGQNHSDGEGDVDDALVRRTSVQTGLIRKGIAANAIGRAGCRQTGPYCGAASHI